ncbi:hypothetical protein [Vibrio sp. D431a]|uniref:hypothetical protein n=1 Tax=Vibrio sp. D431a TaxID=2837388 RepID=UPI002553F986|nr:hypothetical protein [Vibrio sp. D431a]MDK9789854.1 hypothetical protein [Vibrio sp. D431a]
MNDNDPSLDIIQGVEKVNVISTSVWVKRTNKNTFVIYAKHNHPRFTEFPFAVVKINPDYFSARTTKEIVTKLAIIAGVKESLEIHGETLNINSDAKDPSVTKVWIESGMFGEKHIMVSVEENDTPFRAITLNYNYGYTSNAGIRMNAEEMASYLGYDNVEFFSSNRTLDEMKQIIEDDYEANAES